MLFAHSVPYACPRREGDVAEPGQPMQQFVLRSCAALALLAATTPALALDAAKVADNMARRASQAYEAGDFEHAAQFYLEAFRTWNAVPAYLYGAARAEHVAGQHDAAEQHYRQYLAHPNSEPARVTKVRNYLQELATARAERGLREADAALRTENFKVALPLLLDAVAALPARIDVLLRAARTALLAGDPEQAAGLARRVLATATATVEQKRDADALVAQVADKGRAVPGTVQAPATPTVSQASPTPAPLASAPAAIPESLTPVAARASIAPRNDRRLATIALAAGVTMGGAAAGVYLWARADRTALDQAIAQKDAQGLITGISKADTLSQVASIESRKTTAALLAGAGMAAALTGAWLWWRTDVGVAVTPLPDGVAVVGRF